MQSTRRELIEIEVLTEGHCLRIDRMDQHGTRSDDLGCRHSSTKGVLQKRSAEAATVFIAVDGQTRQQNDGYRIGWRHFRGDPRRAIAPIH